MIAQAAGCNRRWLAAALVVLLAYGCQDVHGPGGDTDASGAPAAPRTPPEAATPLPALIVSNPASSAGTANSAMSLHGSATDGIVYVSLSPGSVPDGERVVIATRGTAANTEAVLRDGGFDPVAVTADVGDTLDVHLYLTGEPESVDYVSVVPERRTPVVVRVDPPEGRRDVPLNAVLLLVFSEPIDGRTLTPTSVSLSREGSPVAGALAFSDPAGLTVTFTPAELLSAGADYILLVSQGLVDIDGDALDGPTVIEFATIAGAAGGDPPLGSQLVFASETDRQIYTVGTDGTGRRRLTNAGRNSRPSWSPDGRRIAFARDGGGGSDIYVMDADGANVVRRTVDSRLWPQAACCVPGGLESVAWSPDGRWLAVSTEGLYDSDIWIIPADDDGSSPLHIATGARSPAWSPDGRRIAFVRTSGDDGYDALGIMNADGTDATLVTPALGGRYGVGWSPDGRHITASVCELGGCDVFVMALDGTDVRRLTGVGNASWGGSWSSDGRWLAITQWDTAHGPFVAYVAADGGITRAVADDAFAPSWRP